MPTKLDGITEETRDELASLALKLSGNKKTRKGFLGLVKEANPETPIPELDEPARFEEVLKGEREAREKFEQEQRTRWFQQDLEKQKNDVRAKFGLSDSDMTAMEKMMTEKKLPADYTWAAPLYKQQTESATPTNYGSSGFGPLDIERNAGQDEFKGLMEDETNWSVRTAHQMIDDMARGKAR